MKLIAVIVAIVTGLLGWVMFFLLLWSTRGKALMRLEKRVKELTGKLEKAEKKVAELTGLLEHKHTMLKQVEENYNALRDKVERIETANESLRTIVERVGLQVEQEKKRGDDFYQRYLKLLGDTGGL